VCEKERPPCGGLSKTAITLDHAFSANQPLVTTGTGALPLPIGALPMQAERPKATTAEQITNNNFLIGQPPLETSLFDLFGK
jgi:hypothetical protein